MQYDDMWYEYQDLEAPLQELSSFIQIDTLNHGIDVSRKKVSQTAHMEYKAEFNLIGSRMPSSTHHTL